MALLSPGTEPAVFPVDVHRHRRPGPSAGFYLRNAFHFSGPAAVEKLGYPVSAGIHPMHAGRISPDCLVRLAAVLRLPGVLAVGECGLDSRFAHAGPQAELFAWQVQQASMLGKPLILHLVKSDEEALKILAGCPVPFLYHGFRGTATRLRKWLMNDNAWVSFGMALLRDPTLTEVFLACPPERRFLESDDSPMPVSVLHAFLEEKTGIPAPVLMKEQMENARLFFRLTALPIFEPKNH